MTTTVQSEATTTSATTAVRGADRVGAAAGIAFVVLNVIAAFAPGAPPASDASPAKVVAYFTDHGGGIKAQLVLGALGMIGLLWWFGSLSRLFTRPGEERSPLLTVAALGLGFGLAVVMIGACVASAAAQRIDVLGEGSQIFFTLSLVASAAAGFGIATFLLAAAVLTHRTKVLPAWTSYLALLSGAAFLVGSLAAISDANAYNLCALAAFLLWCAWIVVVSTVLWRDPA